MSQMAVLFCNVLTHMGKVLVMQEWGRLVQVQDRKGKTHGTKY